MIPIAPALDEELAELRGLALAELAALGLARAGRRGGSMTCTYASAIGATPMRCRRFVDDSTPGSSARVCGAPIPAIGAGIAASYCPTCVTRLTAAPARSQPRLPRGPIADDWVMPSEAELTEVFG